MLFIFMFYFAILTPELFYESIMWDRIEATGPVMRSTFVICYILFAVGLCIKVFRQYEINYMHIFEIDERNRVRQYTIWRLAIVLLFVWTCAFCFNIMEISLEVKQNLQLNGDKIEVKQHIDWISLTLVVIFLIICM